MSNNDDQRAARLAEQLRANLRKRKEQARGRPASPGEQADQPDNARDPAER
ncbi:hypothetical protein [uncultured Sphingomonas sp.]|uniref:hypothetical protein n=1 Tax=uncultured Sphingomonas sp. TaxID=158754 RepID=UPI0026272A7A|nr:hypothetical protein [uncultured Sphingomonas sp.]